MFIRGGRGQNHFQKEETGSASSRLSLHSNATVTRENRGDHEHTTLKDGTTIYYKDWGTGQPITFSHGWPLNADAWDAQMLFFGNLGYRVIAHDRRSHGRSSQTWDGNEMNTYADDLAELFGGLDLKDAIMVGHSTGGGVVARYIARHGTSRVAKAVLISAVPPIMVKSEHNPIGTPIEALNAIRDGVVNDRSQFYKDLSLPFFGYNRPRATISEACARTSGSRVCRMASRAPTTASRRSLKPTSPKT